MANRTVTVALKVQMASAVAAVRTMQKTVGDFRTELRAAAKEGQMDEVANGLGMAGAGIAAALGIAIAAAAQFEKAMAGVQAATRATGEQMESLRHAAIRAGSETQFSAAEAAQGITELAKAGVSLQDILSGGLDGALSLAAAGELAVADAAEIAASALVQFKLAGDDVPHVADLLAAGAGKAQGTVQDLGQALNQGGLVAAQMGLSIEETTGTLAAFANAGLMGSDAGTSFKTMLLRLAAPTDEVRSLMDDLGIAAYDANGQFVGMTAFAEDLRTSLAGMTQQQRDQAMATIFGADAIRAASIIYEQGGDGIQSWIEKVNDSGYAAEEARLKTDHLLGDIERLGGSLESVFITSTGGAADGLRGLVQLLTAVVNGFGGLPGPIQQGVVWLAALTAGALLLSAGYLKLIPALAAANAQLAAMGPLGAKAAAGMTALRGTVGPAAGVFGVATIAYMLFGDALESAIGLKVADRDVNKLTKSLGKFSETGKASGELTAVFGKNLEDLGSKFDLAAIAASRAALEAGQVSKVKIVTDFEIEDINLEAYEGVKLDQAVEDVSALDEALVQLVQNGGNHAAAFAMIADAAAEQGVSIAEVTAGLPQYKEAIEAANTANTGLAKGFGSAEAQAATMAMSLEDAIRQGQTLTDVFNMLNGAATQYAEAEIAAEAATDALTEALDESGGSMDITTEAGRRAKGSMLDMVSAAVAAAQAKYEESGSVSEAAATYNEYIAALKETLRQAGLTEDEIEDLIDTYAQIPTSIWTTVGVRYKKTGTGALSGFTNLDDFTRWHGVADGAVFNAPRSVTSYANGGEHHVAQIARPGDWRVWAEPETGGEAYIPLAASKRDRSMAIWREVGRRFGAFDSGVSSEQIISALTSAAGSRGPISVNVQAHTDYFSWSQVERELAFQGVV